LIPNSCIRFVLALLFQAIISINLNSQDYSLSIQTGHSLAINSLSYSPDGTLLLSSGNDNLVVLWDVLSGKQIRSFIGHSAPVHQALFHPGMLFMVSISDDRTLKIWNLNTGAMIRSIELRNHYVKAMAMSNDGNFIAVAGDTVRLINTDTWQVATLPLTNDPYFNCIAFSHNGNTLAVGGTKTSKILLFDIQSRSVVSSFNLRCKELAFSIDDRYLAGAGIYGKLRRWDLKSNYKTLTRFSIPENKWIDAYYAVAISPDIDFFAGGNLNHRINMYSIKNAKTHLIIRGHEKKVTALAFSPNGNYLASTGEDRKIIIWKVSDGSNVKIMKSLNGKINSIAVKSNSESIAVGKDNGTCSIIEVRPDGAMNSIRLQPSFFQKMTNWQYSINKVKIMPDGETVLISADLYKEVSRINSFKVKHKPAIASWNYKTNEIKVFTTKYKPILVEGKGIFLPNWRKNLLYKIDSRSLIKKEIIPLGKIDAKPSQIDKAWIDDNERYIAYSLIYNGTLNGLIVRDMLFDSLIFNEKFKYRLMDFKFISFSECAFALEDGYIYTYDLSQKIVTHTYKGKPPLSFNGQLLSFMGNENEIVNTDIYGGSLNKFATTHTNIINSLEFLGNSNTIITGGADGSIKFIETKDGYELSSLIPIGNSDRIYITPDHFYFASKGALNTVGFTDGIKIYSFEQFDVIFNRPDIVYKQLGFTDSVQYDYYYSAYLKRIKRLGLTNNDLQGTTFDIPELQILSKNIPLSTNSDTLNLNFKAISYLSLLDRLNITINGVPLFGKNGIDISKKQLRDMTIPVKLYLSDGKNKVKITVRNKRGIESLPVNVEINKQESHKKPNLYLISIGVSKHKEDKYNLKYAAKDATDFLKSMYSSKSMYNKIYSKELIDSAVSLANIRNLNSFLNKAEVNDVVILFLAGHGMLDQNLDYYFASYDNEFENPSLKGISYVEIENIVDSIKPRKKFIFIDACHSGEFDKDEVTLASNIQTSDGPVHFRVAGTDIKRKGAPGSQSIFELSKMLFSDMKNNSGAIIVSSAGGAEYAMEGDKWQNGIFTYCLLKGLKEKKADLNKDGIITASEIQKYVYKEVSDKTNGKQRPTTRVENLSNDFRIW
jgi:WD40 repeat protein